MIKNLLIVSNLDNDFSRLLNSLKSIEVTAIAFNNLTDGITDKYDAFAVLGNPTTDILNRKSLDALNLIIASEKPTFIRVMSGICGITKNTSESTRFKRLVYTGHDGLLTGIDKNDLLDDQDNLHTPAVPSDGSVPLLVYKDKVMSHDKYKGENPVNLPSEYALWLESPSNIFCTFDISNFTKARFAPIAKWHSIIKYIISFLSGSSEKIVISPGYTNGFIDKTLSASPLECFNNAISWFNAADILIEGGKQGVYEGYATEIKSTGIQKKAMEIRNDCCGETMLAYYMNHMLTGSKKALEISDNISDFIFSTMYTNEPGGILDGMMKWSLTAYNICYQDDVARSVIPQMMKCRYSGTTEHLDKCTRALEFLYKTTGTDGLRVTRTDNNQLNASEIERLASEPAEYPSAHYTAYYLGALLLNYTMTENEKFKDMGIRGLESIMAVYPDTKRCQSETQELCRLVLPLSLLYEATGLQKHKDMLYKVVSDLQEYRHKSGSYVEWDTGYSSRYSRTEGDECSILTENGDPVTDLLYSINWLPVGFIQAYLITKDTMFIDLWKDITDFMVKSQIHSQYAAINGAWARGFDVELNEVFALPNDVGWGPWCIESGWTVAEIAAGIAMGLLKDTLIKFY